jgi:hypothetical protein
MALVSLLIDWEIEAASPSLGFRKQLPGAIAALPLLGSQRNVRGSFSHCLGHSGY